MASDVYDAVLDGDISGVSTQLQSSDNVYALAEGLRFPSDRRNELLTKTGDRQGDPDVVTLKAVAKAALSSRQYYELSRVLTIAVYPEGWSTNTLLLDAFVAEFRNAPTFQA